MSAVDLQPDELETLQAETGEAPAALVHVDGPIRVQDLPRKAGATFTKTGVTTTPFRLLRADHRRAVARIMSTGQAMRVALSMASAQDPSTMALWPAGSAFTVTADTDIWVASDTSTTTISVVTEYWATGE